MTSHSRKKRECGKPKRACLHTLGCRLNQAETAIIEDELRTRGYDVVAFGEPADLAIINTCTVTREADAKARQAIRGFVRANPHAFTAVIGCYSQMGYDAIAAIEGVDLIVGNQEKLNVLDYVGETKNAVPTVVRGRIERDDFTIDRESAGGVSKRSNLKVQDGCDFMCSFCIIAFARGRARSRALDDLLGEARLLVSRGVKEIVVAGVNIGLYRHDGKDIADVAEALAQIDGLRHVRISSLELKTIPDRLLAMMDDPAHPLVPYVHVPLQSGSDRILKAMKRRYTRKQFVEFVHRAKENVRDVCVGTDIMAGFPGETDGDFDDTLSVLRDAPIDYAHVFKYSEREGTASARLPDKVDPKDVTRRAAMARRLAAIKRRRFYEAHLGRELSVLFEDQQDGLWCGYTENYVRVGVRSSESLENEIRQVRLTRLDGAMALGTLR